MHCVSVQVTGFSPSSMPGRFFSVELEGGGVTWLLCFHCPVVLLLRPIFSASFPLHPQLVPLLICSALSAMEHSHSASARVVMHSYKSTSLSLISLPPLSLSIAFPPDPPPFPSSNATLRFLISPSTSSYPPVRSLSSFLVVPVSLFLPISRHTFSLPFTNPSSLMHTCIWNERNF